MLSQETRVGLFVMGAVLIIGIASFYLGDVRFERYYRVHILFDNVAGLPDKAAVKCSGVEIGRVRKIDLIGSRARVTVDIKQKYPIHKDTVAKVASTGFIGSKFLSITRGTSSAPWIEDGDTIQGKTSLSFDDLADKLTELFKKDEKYGDPIENIRATLANLKKATGDLHDTLAANKQSLTSLVKSANQVAKDLEEITSQTKEDIKSAIAHFRKVTEYAESLLTQVKQGKGAVGTLVSDEETGKQVKETVSSLRETAKDAETIFGRIRRISVYWDYRQRYDFTDSRYKADFGIKLVPRPGKFYELAINNIGTQKDRSKPDVDLERKNTITAVLGKEFGPFTAYVGIIRSRGGIGGVFRPFWMNPAWDRRFELQAEAYDFSRQETLQGVQFARPVYNAGASVGIFRWLYAGAQVEDIAVRSHVVGHVNIRLKDEDIAYLLGLVSLGKP